MKIVHILPRFDTGGGEKFCIDMCNELAKDKNNEVYLCVISEILDTEILAQKVDRELVNLVPLNKKSSGKSFKTFIDMYKFLKDIKPDITHTHLRAQVYGSLPFILLGIPNIHTIHNMAQKETGAKVRSFYRFLYKNFKFTPVSISDEVLESTKEVYGEEFDVKIDNGAKALNKTDKYGEVEKFVESLKSSSDTKIFISVARLMPQKNILMMVEAFETLISQGYDIHLLLVGSFLEDKEYADKCIANIVSKDRIHVLGEKLNVSDYMYNSDALVMSSIYEGMPIIILEAMSAGIPILSTPVGGVPDTIIEDVNGYLSSDVSTQSFMEIIKKYLKNSNTFDSSKIVDIFEDNYSIESTVKKYYSLYESKVSRVVKK